MTAVVRPVLGNAAYWTAVLDAAANAGQGVVPVASTVGATAGASVFIRKADGTGTADVGVIASVSAGVSVTLVANLVGTYASGDIISASPVELALARGTYASLGARVTAMGPLPPDAADADLFLHDPAAVKRGQVRQLARNADGTALQSDLPMALGVRRNVWQYTEDMASNRYTVANATKQTDSIVVDGITLTRVSSTNFYGNCRSQVGGLGQTPFIAGQRYLISCYACSRLDVEQFVWMRALADTGSFGHGAKLLTGRPRRIWMLGQATTTSAMDLLASPLVDLGSGTASDVYWMYTGYTEGPGTFGTVEVYLGGFQIEQLADATYDDGIALVGDSTMAGSACGIDYMDTAGAREVSTWLGALLNCNVFNRAVGGRRFADIIAAWATDVTAIKNVCRYVVIQGGVLDISNRTLAQMQADMASLVALAVADGLRPVIFTVTPNMTSYGTPAAETLRGQFNAWLKQTYPDVIDIASVVADQADPTSIRRHALWYGDGTHYLSAAKRAIAIYAARQPVWDLLRSPSPYQKLTAAVYAPTASLTLNGPRAATPGATQVLVAATTILANAETVAVSCTGSVTSTAAPTIADGTDGQIVTLLNVGAGTYTISDQGTLASSNLRLTAATVAIAPRQSVRLIYSATVGDWVQVGALVAVI